MSNHPLSNHPPLVGNADGDNSEVLKARIFVGPNGPTKIGANVSVLREGLRLLPGRAAGHQPV
jgi:hypothetical protein